MHCGHGVTSDFKVWSRGHSRISVDTNCVSGLSRKYNAYGSDHPLRRFIGLGLNYARVTARAN